MGGIKGDSRSLDYSSDPEVIARFSGQFRVQSLGALPGV